MNQIIILFCLFTLFVSCSLKSRVYKNSQIYDENIEATIQGTIFGAKGEKQEFLSYVKVIPGEYYYASFNEVLGIPLAYYIWTKGEWTYWTPRDKYTGKDDFIPGLGLEEISIHTLFAFLWHSSSEERLWVRNRTSQGLIETIFKVNPEFQGGKVPEIMTMYLNDRKILEMKVLEYKKK